MNGARYYGYIKSFNPQKGWGFIECEQTQEQFGKDMFVLKNSLPGGVASRGDEVSFGVALEHNGPVACDVQVMRRAGLLGPSQPPPMASMELMSQAAFPSSQTFVGLVKSFKSDTGWGMIASPQMQQLYGKDVFFSRSVVQGGLPLTGEQVAFTIKMEAKGPAAASVQVLWKERQAALQAPPFPMQQGYNTPGRWAAAAPLASRVNQTFFGVLKSFNEEKGWGHISCDATSRVYGKDVFLMKGALRGQVVEPGTLLSFKVNMGAKGPQATSVALLPPGSFRLSSATDVLPVEEPMVFVGQVKSFNAEKGWGFVTSEDLHQTFGKDIFIHKHELDGRALEPGEEVRISVEIDDGGQPVARAVSELSGMEFPGMELPNLYESHPLHSPPTFNARVSPY